MEKEKKIILEKGNDTKNDTHDFKQKQKIYGRNTHHSQRHRTTTAELVRLEFFFFSV